MKMHKKLLAAIVALAWAVTALAAAVLAVASLPLSVLVAVSRHPIIALDGDIAGPTHRWAVGHRDITHAFRILSDWVWDPATMRILCGAAVVWLVRRHRAWWLALWVAGTCAVGALVQTSLEAAVGRPRPVWPNPVDSAHNAAFSSGQSMTPRTRRP